MAAAGGRLQVVSLDGTLAVYEGESPVATFSLEPTVRSLKVFGTDVVAIGERKLYHVSPARTLVLTQSLPLAGTRWTYGDSESPVVIDANGKGVRFDRALFVTSSFHTAAGARPISADDAGRLIAFRLDDGSHSLMVDGKVTFTQQGGTLAVGRGGEAIVAGHGGGTRVLTLDELSQRT
jgi:hypothetical protein